VSGVGLMGIKGRVFGVQVRSRWHTDAQRVGLVGGCESWRVRKKQLRRDEGEDKRTAPLWVSWTGRGQQPSEVDT
jgi:hypothetical protein